MLRIPYIKVLSIRKITRSNGVTLSLVKEGFFGGTASAGKLPFSILYSATLIGLASNIRRLFCFKYKGSQEGLHGEERTGARKRQDFIDKSILLQ